MRSLRSAIQNVIHETMTINQLSLVIPYFYSNPCNSRRMTGLVDFPAVLIITT